MHGTAVHGEVLARLRALQERRELPDRSRACSSVVDHVWGRAADETHIVSWEGRRPGDIVFSLGGFHVGVVALDRRHQIHLYGGEVAVTPLLRGPVTRIARPLSAEPGPSRPPSGGPSRDRRPIPPSRPFRRP